MSGDITNQFGWQLGDFVVTNFGVRNVDLTNYYTTNIPCAESVDGNGAIVTNMAVTNIYTLKIRNIEHWYQQPVPDWCIIVMIFLLGFGLSQLYLNWNNWRMK